MSRLQAPTEHGLAPVDELIALGYEPAIAEAFIKAAQAIAELEWSVFNQSNQQTHAI